jgi:hypothetical protein
MGWRVVSIYWSSLMLKMWKRNKYCGSGVIKVLHTPYFWCVSLGKQSLWVLLATPAHPSHPLHPLHFANVKPFPAELLHCLNISSWPQYLSYVKATAEVVKNKVHSGDESSITTFYHRHFRSNKEFQDRVQRTFCHFGFYIDITTAKALLFLCPIHEIFCHGDVWVALP